MTLKVAGVAETVTVTGETPLIETTLVVGRRRRRHRAHREPAAQRPAVRQPGGDGSRRRPRLPLRPDQEHAVLAADQRRQRPQRQLPDRRRRQQRRHGRRPAAALPARSDPGVQRHHAALQGGVRPQQRRRAERRDQERHQRPARQLVHAVPRQGAERADVHRADQRGSTSRTTAATSSAAAFGGPIVREPGALLRRLRADAAGHEPGGRHARPLPGRGRHLHDARSARTCSPAR